MKINHTSITYLLYKVLMKITKKVTTMKYKMENITHYRAFEKSMGTIGKDVKF